MTLEKHVIDTMKEWQTKIGGFDSDIRLYYPKNVLCRYLHLPIDTDNSRLVEQIEEYFADNVKYLGNVTVSAQQDRFCILVGKEGCDYVEKRVPEPEFLIQFLKVLKQQDMQSIFDFFEQYAKKMGTTCIYSQKEEEGLETLVYFEKEEVEPYVYCIDQNVFGITYHRFTREEIGEIL